MSTIVWRDEYNINVAELDAQHRRIAELVNALHEVVSTQQGKADVVVALQALIEYTRMHFRTEERLMQEYEYSEMEAHRQEHKDLLRQLDFIAHKLTGGVGPVFSADLDVSGDWVMIHLLGSDKRLGLFLNSREVS